MALDLAGASAVLKDLYLPVIREQINQKIMFLNQVERSTEDVEGAQVKLSLHVSRNSGVGARADNDDLPSAGAQGYVKESVDLRHVYGRIQISGPTLRAMKSDRGSFTRALESESKGVSTDLKRDVNRQLFGTSDGVIATCGTTSSSTTVVLAAATFQSALRAFEEGAKVDIGTTSNPTSIASARTVTAVNRATPSITISGAAVSTTSAAFVFRSGSGGTGASQKEVTGAQTIINDSGTLFGVDPSTYPIWKSTVDSNSGTARTLTDDLLESVLDTVDVVAGEFPTLLVASHGVVRAYAAGLKDQKRFSNTTELKGGFKAAVIDTTEGSLPLTKDRDTPDAQALIFNTNHWKINEQSDWEWMQEDGAVLSRVSGKDAYEATLYKDLEQTTDRRNAHARIKDLSEAS